MPLPWLQIVQLVPSIVEVSRELLKKTRRAPESATLPEPQGADDSALRARIVALEDNERRQAELVNQMAEQISVLTSAVTSLQQRQLWLILATAGSICLAVVALIMAGVDKV